MWAWVLQYSFICLVYFVSVVIFMRDSLMLVLFFPGWTISKLSPTLSFLVKWKTVKEAVVGAVRRSLCFPLYRHWELSMKVLDDLKFLVTKGKSGISFSNLGSLN